MRDNGEKGIELKSNCLRLQLRSSRNGIYSIWERRGRRVRREIEKERERMEETLGRSGHHWKRHPGGFFVAQAAARSLRYFISRIYVFHLPRARVRPFAHAFSRHTAARGTFEFDLRLARCSYVLSLCSESRRVSGIFWKNNMQAHTHTHTHARTHARTHTHTQGWYKFWECHGEISRECCS